jgi:hypothetical protein
VVGLEFNNFLINKFLEFFVVVTVHL